MVSSAKLTEVSDTEFSVAIVWANGDQTTKNYNVERGHLVEENRSNNGNVIGVENIVLHQDPLRAELWFIGPNGQRFAGPRVAATLQSILNRVVGIREGRMVQVHEDRPSPDDPKLKSI